MASTMTMREVSSLDDIEVPKVGKLPLKIIVPVGVLAVAYVGYRWYQSRGASTATVDPNANDFGSDDGTIPDTLNPFPSSPPASGGSGDTGAVDVGPGSFTNDAQWTDYAATKLSQDGQYSYTDIATAIGLALGGKSTTDAQQQILRAVIAVAGYPPVGTLSIVSGGNTAPVGVPIPARPTATSSTFHMSWAPVAGADHYVITNKSSGSTYTTTTTSYTVTGLKPSTTYTFTVAAANAAGLLGPAATETGKTAAAPVNKNPVGYGWYKVGKGEDINDVAKKKGISTAEFVQFNGSNALKAGEWVKVRAAANPSSGYKG